MELVFASNNHNKIREIQEILGKSFKILSLKEIGCDEELPETQNTIEGNARQKSFYIYENYARDCFSDDSGLEIDALSGAPGVDSAHYAGESRNDKANIEKVLKELEGVEERTAQFKTIISLVIHGRERQFIGIVKGKIAKEPWGENGFGYDPIFIPEGYFKTFAEMDSLLKNKISHRAMAVKYLVDYLNTIVL